MLKKNVVQTFGTRVCVCVREEWMKSEYYQYVIIIFSDFIYLFFWSGTLCNI